MVSCFLVCIDLMEFEWKYFVESIDYCKLTFVFATGKIIEKKICRIFVSHHTLQFRTFCIYHSFNEEGKKKLFVQLLLICLLPQRGCQTQQVTKNRLQLDQKVLSWLLFDWVGTFFLFLHEMRGHLNWKNP